MVIQTYLSISSGQWTGGGSGSGGNTLFTELFLVWIWSSPPVHTSSNEKSSLRASMEPPPPLTGGTDYSLLWNNTSHLFSTSGRKLCLTSTEGGHVLSARRGGSTKKGVRGWTLRGRDVRFYCMWYSLTRTTGVWEGKNERKKVRRWSERWTYCANCSFFSHCGLKTSN